MSGAGLPAGEAVEVALLDPKDSAEWDAFVRSSRAPHFYNETAFFEHYRHKVLSLHPLVFRRKGRIVAAVPFGLVERDGEKEFRSPFSSSFSGFSHQGITLADAYRCMEGVMVCAKDLGAGSVVIQQPPVVYCREPDDVWDFVSHAFGFRLAAWDLSYWVPVSDEFLAGISGSTRWAINRNERRGLTFEEEPDLLAAYDFVAQSRMEGGLTLSMSRADMAQLGECFGERIHCARVRFEGRTLAVSINYLMSPWAALCMFWARSQGDVEELRPLDVLLARYVMWLHTKGFRVYDFGTTSINGVPEWGVTQYKEKFGVRGTLRRRLVKELQP